MSVENPAPLGLGLLRALLITTGLCAAALIIAKAAVVILKLGIEALNVVLGEGRGVKLTQDHAAGHAEHAEHDEVNPQRPEDDAPSARWLRRAPSWGRADLRLCLELLAGLRVDEGKGVDGEARERRWGVVLRGFIGVAELVRVDDVIRELVAAFSTVVVFTRVGGPTLSTKNWLPFGHSIKEGIRLGFMAEASSELSCKHL